MSRRSLGSGTAASYKAKPHWEGFLPVGNWVAETWAASVVDAIDVRAGQVVNLPAFASLTPLSRPSLPELEPPY